MFSVANPPFHLYFKKNKNHLQASFGGSGSGESGEPMHVPEDAFTGEGGQNLTPERKAATALGNLFTMAATRVILDQFTGTRHRSPVYYKMVGTRLNLSHCQKRFQRP